MQYRLLIALILFALCSPAMAQGLGKPKRFDFWSIELGASAADIPDKFIDYACGTIGGPPATPLKGFKDFSRCRAEASGLREVYFRYDDELEYWAKAMELEREIKLFRGTQMYDFPVILSLLIDEAGIVRGRRIVTDPRYPDIRERADLFTLGNFLVQRFTRADWTCENLPAEEGETPVGTDFVKSRCIKAGDGLMYFAEQRFFRKKGQMERDPTTGQLNIQAFTSSTRFEMSMEPFGKRAGL